jgi:hypothetical protein
MSMIKSEPLISKEQTGKEMKRITTKYCDDLRTIFMRYKGNLVSISDLPFIAYYDLIKNMRYKQDKAPVEVVARPKILLQGVQDGAGLDCKKKAILIASWICLNVGKKNYRFIASSKRKDKQITHVFPEILVNQKWLPVDATYPQNKPFKMELLTNKEIL